MPRSISTTIITTDIASFSTEEPSSTSSEVSSSSETASSTSYESTTASETSSVITGAASSTTPDMSISSSVDPIPPSTTSSVQQSGGLSGPGALILGIFIGILLVGMVFGAFMLYKKRKMQRARSRIRWDIMSDKSSTREDPSDKNGEERSTSKEKVADGTTREKQKDVGKSIARADDNRDVGMAL